MGIYFLAFVSGILIDLFLVRPWGLSSLKLIFLVLVVQTWLKNFRFSRKDKISRFSQES